MEITKVELTAVVGVTEQIAMTDIVQLSELQLLLIGGGIGDVVFG